MKHEWSVKSEENDAAKAKWGAEKVDIPRNVEDLLSIVKEAKTTYPGVKSWGAYGLCWGGKVCNGFGNSKFMLGSRKIEQLQMRC